MAIEVPIPSAIGVSGMLLYLGLSSGWHIGKAMTEFDRQRREGERWRTLLVRAFWRASHHYDLGVAMATVGAALLLPNPTPIETMGFLLIGFGVGMAYDDRADHPPEGMFRYMLNRVRSSFGGDAS